MNHELADRVFTLSDIRALNPCYDPSRYLPEDWRGTIIDGLQLEHAPPKDRIWVAIGLLDDRTNRLFAVWCAREALALIGNPDPRSISACDVAERYANGLATRDELDAAGDAAGDAAWDAAGDAARTAARAAAYAAAYAAAQDAAGDAARTAAWAAAGFAAWAAAGFAAWAAAYAAAWAAAGVAARDAAWAAAYAAAGVDAGVAVRTAQIKKLISMIEEKA